MSLMVRGGFGKNFIIRTQKSGDDKLLRTTE